MISGKKLLMFRNLWYFDDRDPQVPRDIILAPETNGILSAYLLLQLGKVKFCGVFCLVAVSWVPTLSICQFITLIQDTFFQDISKPRIPKF